MSEFLSPAELRELTERQHRDAQERALRALGIPFRAVGRSIKVSRVHVRAWLEGRPISWSEPNFGAIK